MRILSIAKIISGVAVALAVAHVIWPALGIDAVTIGLMVLAAAPWLMPHLRSMELPGGVKIELKDVKEATEQVLVGAVSSQQNETLAAQNEERDLEAQLQFLEEVGGRDPNLMLVGFRIEVEKRLLALAEANNFRLARAPIPRVINILRENEILPPQVATGLSDLIGLGNRAAHGAQVVPEAAQWVLEVGIEILRALDRLILASNQGAPNKRLEPTSGTLARPSSAQP